jgi:hypothetical protein
VPAACSDLHNGIFCVFCDPERRNCCRYKAVIDVVNFDYLFVPPDYDLVTQAELPFAVASTPVQSCALSASSAGAGQPQHH